MIDRDPSAYGPRRSNDLADIRLRRSALMTPGDNGSLVRKAAASAADVCIVDWEDAVFASRKAEAREITTEIFTTVDFGPRERVIRCNANDTPFFADDIDAAVASGTESVLLAKVYEPADVIGAVALLEAAEQRHGREDRPVEVWSMIETAKALTRVEDIAACHPRMTAILFGGGDLGADLRIKRVSAGANRTLGPIRFEYIYGYSRLVTAARAAGIDPINMGFTSFDDIEGTREDAEFAAQFGFTGCLAYSPRQLEAVNGAFGPSADDLEWAGAILQGFDEAGESGRTVSVVHGEMSDAPYVRVAIRLQRMREAIEARG